MNKFILRGAALLLLTLPSFARAQAQPAPAPTVEPVKSQQDIEHDAVWAIYREQPADPELRVNNPRESFRFQDEHMRRFAEAGRAYAAKYPDDPRRYNALIQASYTRPWFLTGFKPEFDAKPNERNLTVDEPALIAFWEAQLGYLAEVITAPVAVVRQRGGAMVAYLTDSRSLAKVRGVPYDWAPLDALVDRALAIISDETVMPVVEVYRDALVKTRPEAVAAFDAKIQTMPKVAAAMAAIAAERETAAAEKARKLAALGEMAFTAADGREVSLAALKGKVVLVDFWATWCGPCIAELPNVVANYNKYHDRGFEVVGITLENPGFTPKDTPEQTAAKLEKAKAKMLAFTETNGMPWPQYYDGKWWKNDYAVKFGIESIPAMFLLDQQGNIVATEARGPRLEAEIKRLLKL